MRQTGQSPTTATTTKRPSSAALQLLAFPEGIERRQKPVAESPVDQVEVRQPYGVVPCETDLDEPQTCLGVTGRWGGGGGRRRTGDVCCMSQRKDH